MKKRIGQTDIGHCSGVVFNRVDAHFIPDEEYNLRVAEQQRIEETTTLLERLNSTETRELLRASNHRSQTIMACFNCRNCTSYLTCEIHDDAYVRKTDVCDRWESCR